MPSVRAPQSPDTHAPRRGLRERGRVVIRLAVLFALGALTAFSLTRSDALREAQAATNRNDDLTATRRALDHLARWPRSQEAAKRAALALSRMSYAALAEPYYARAGKLSLAEMHTRAESLMRCNERLKAIEAFQAILARQPDDIQALQLEAGVLLTMYRRTQALALATKLTQIPGGEVIGYSMVGFIQHLLEDPESAVVAYERVLQLDPELKATPIPHKQFWLEFAQDLIRQGRGIEARRYLLRALGEKEDAELTDLLGMAYEQGGEIEDAELAWHNAVQLDPGYSPAWLKLGLLALKSGRVEDARERLERALALAPKSYSAVYNLSLTYRRLGRLDDANRLKDEAARLRRLMPQQAGGMGAIPGGGPP